MTERGTYWRNLASIVLLEGSVSSTSLLERFCELLVERCALVGCAVSLTAGGQFQGALAAAGPLGASIAELQFTIGEGPCVDACRTNAPVAIADLADAGLARWPGFTPDALELGVRAIFANPLGDELAAFGSLHLSRAYPGLLDAGEAADARAMARIAGGVVLRSGTTSGPHQAAEPFPTSPSEEAHLSVHQAVGMVCAQLDTRPADALARLRAHAFLTSQPLYAVSKAVLSRTLRFDP